MKSRIEILSRNELEDALKGKMLYKGLFWVRDINECDIIALRFESDENGVPADSTISSKDINHKRLWEQLDSVITGGMPYNFYPRGRVELRRGKALIFCSPHICTDKLKTLITEYFGLTADNGIKEVILKADGSAHYRCEIDGGANT
ncbi:MAG: hypothetical protein K6F91_09465 [Ruminococcus sp.]|nr:hypothetical protein [Ruminococcus sp.]